MPARKKAVSTQKAHLTKQEIEERTQAEASVQTDVEEIMKPPAWLNSTIAKNEWKRVIPQLLKINIAGNLDLEALAGYCNAFANYRKAVEELGKQSLLIVNQDEETGFSYIKENPLNNVCIKWGKEMRTFADLCGITMNSRIKQGQAKVDKQKQDIEDEFGDI